MADGPAGQASSVRALKAGATMAKVLKMVEKFRKADRKTPIVHIGAAGRQLLQDGEAGLHVRVAGGDKGHEGGAAFLLQTGESVR